MRYNFKVTCITIWILSTIYRINVECNRYFSLTSQNIRHSIQLDSGGKYLMHWNFNQTHITFEVQVETWGYVGFGISQNGKMFPADIVVSWVKDGKVNFLDCHTSRHGLPLKDSKQDWRLLDGEENDSGTRLKFVRKFDTCDDEDIAINEQTIRLIYSYHPEDPVSESSLMYHGFERRGTKSVSLLSSSLPPASFQNEDVKIVDFRNNNFLLPQKHTTYLCTGFQLPDLGGKHHIIEFEPIISSGNERYVHHLDVLKCRGSHPHLDQATAECLQDWPETWPDCPENLLAWGTGGGPFYFPEHTGYSIGAEDDAVFYVMQLHYNNPERTSGVIDSSGIRLGLTSNLRQFDVGNIMLGHALSALQVVPPKAPSYVTRGYCDKACFTVAMQQSNVTEVKVIAVFQHAHMLATGITTRHFRNGTELPPVIHDPYYDFFFQEIRPLQQEVTIKEGDSFIVECTYNTVNQTNATYGGASTKDEMCLSYLYAYPKLPLMACVSVSTYDRYNMNEFELQRMFHNMDWQDQVVRNDFKQKMANSSVMHVCENRSSGKTQMKTFKIVEDTKTFTDQAEGVKCNMESS